MYANSKSVNVDLEKEYTPSLHSKRFQDCSDPRDELLKNFLTITGNETSRVKTKYNVKENVRYGEHADDNQVMDIYFKDQENEKPIFVFIHGGYWQSLDKSTAGIFVAPLVEKNYRVIVMDYNLCPQVTLEKMMGQTRTFFHWLLNYAKMTNASKIAISGHSVGAHLASLILYEQCSSIPYADRICSLFLMSGLYDLQELWPLECANPNNILSIDAQKAKELSPFFWNISEKSIKFFKDIKLKVHLMVGENESPTFIGQTCVFAKMLGEKGIDFKLNILPIYDHFDIIEDVFVEGTTVNRYLIENV